VYAVVLAGGGGTRLWPLSRPECPKPFLRLLGEESLIQRTVARLVPLVEPRDVYVVVDRRHLGLVAEQLPAIPPANVIGEPIGRNTAAAVALAAEVIDRPDDEVMLVLPADAHIADEAGFRAALAAAAEVARGGSLVTLGISPDSPETGYGYVLSKPPAREVLGHQVFSVERFVEKPTRERAVELLATGLASWNAGIFAWTRATIRDRLTRHAADILEPIRALAANGTPEKLETAYPAIRATSIDYAVMEPASIEGAVAVVPMSVGWSDLGSWAALRDVWQARSDNQPDGTTIGLGNRRDLGSVETLVLAADRLVVTIGLTGVIVVDTPDAILICAADRSQEVRKIAEELAKPGRSPAANEEKKP
jgi:mannose-1-phosphate guanylyltransferase/mannose-6-phosphate isomerase